MIEVIAYVMASVCAVILIVACGILCGDEEL